MNIESMANYADVIGGIAVIASLIYVGIQICRYEKGFLEDALWDGYKLSMLLYRYTPGGQMFWELRSAHYSELFRNYLDSTSPDDVKSELET